MTRVPRYVLVFALLAAAGVLVMFVFTRADLGMLRTAEKNRMLKGKAFASKLEAAEEELAGASAELAENRKRLSRAYEQGARVEMERARLSRKPAAKRPDTWGPCLRSSIQVADGQPSHLLPTCVDSALGLGSVEFELPSRIIRWTATVKMGSSIAVRGPDCVCLAP